MDRVIVNVKDELVMKLMHYFVTQENYSPIVVKGIKDEIWLENTEAYYKIIRINANHLHNIEQFDYDIYKTKKIVSQVRKKTLSFKVRTLNILLDLSDDVKIEDVKNIDTIYLESIDDLKSEKKIIDIFPNIKNNPLNNAQGLNLLYNATNQINKTTEKKNKDYEEVFKPKKIVVTYVLIALNVLVFLLYYIIGNWQNISLVNLFCVSYNAIRYGQYYRLLTGTFIHINIFHLFFNMYALYIIGQEVENFLGKFKFLVVYLASAIMGSLISCVVLQGNSIGASGAIFGLMGCLLYFGYYYRVYFGNVIIKQILPVILINLMLGFCLSGVDNFAHIGGLIGGVLATMAVGLKNKEQKAVQINGTIVYVILVIFLMFLILK